MPTTVNALIVDSAGAPFRQGTIERRDLRPDDVRIDIAFAGICHSDIHTVREEWGRTRFPLVTGHEIAGVVSEVGSDVVKFKVGDRVGVGCLVDSCGECDQCVKGHENFCERGSVGTYNSVNYDGEWTAGGYARQVVVSERFALSIPDELGLDVAAPLLCAGITTYSPRSSAGAPVPASRSPSSGWAGSVTWASRSAAAMGAEVTVLSHTTSKAADGRAFGAVDYPRDERCGGDVKAARRSFDLILNDRQRRPADRRVPAAAGPVRRPGQCRPAGEPAELQGLRADRRQQGPHRLQDRRDRR